MLDLASLPSTYLTQYGAAKVAEVCGTSEAVVGFWIQQGWPLAAVQKLLDFDPAPLAAIRPLYEVPPEGTKIAVILPSNQPPELATVESLIRMYDPRTMIFKRFTFNSLFHVRNMAAAWFINSGREWSYWCDRDTVAPCGDAPWFREVTGEPEMPAAYAGMNTIQRLLSTGKKLVGVSYVSRRENATPQFWGGNSLEVAEMVRSGPRNQVWKRNWIGFGGALVHRDVFLDIIKTQGDEIRVKNEGVRSQLHYEYGFFNPIDRDEGDDVSFCLRAGKAGHECFVDLALSAGHVGTKIFTHRDIKKR